MHRNQSVQTHHFAMVPRADIPRSSFNIQKSRKLTFDAGYLIPIYLDEVLPGDTFNVRMTAFARLATPLFPLMDNLHLDTFFFFIPNRLVWTNWVRFMGEKDDPSSSTSYVIPQMTSTPGGYPPHTLFDHMGLPTTGQVAAGQAVTHSSLFLRAYNLVWQEWFRDQNLMGAPVLNRGDGPDSPGDYLLRRRGKRHDYFTSALPWPQKGEAVSIPLGTTAPVISSGDGFPKFTNASVGGGATSANLVSTTSSAAVAFGGGVAGGSSPYQWAETKLVADLSVATAATINQLRQSFQIQKLLERDARGGTRYTELVRSHFGVVSPDARLQRPEYLGGGSSPIVINPIAQTSSTENQDTPLGTLGAMGTSLANGHGFSQSFTEHGMILGLACARADLTYQQGLRRMWSRKTRYDFYFPVFAQLGEQAILNKEIYVTGNPATDDAVFGYQERWAEYRYQPSEITGFFRSTTAGTLDGWHLAQRFTSQPVLNYEFIEERPPMSRVLAVGTQADGAHFLADLFFNIRAARPLPMYSVPGLIDHF